ncbi:MAG: Grx4 family monothiol glutaredoxin [Buchnera aphidicola (Periphyllus acericola)]|uniref:Grx4 family monothiol glutaredoxin n=1 Tax=Buchnera aphidicola TaxID=9 RepID=UPI0030CB0D70|nr:Grx4 family monothiol glutaredoxin [Buchnera aphidicola (Periphyllus acericola)]
MKIISKIKNQISKYPILIYMKGSPQFPSCGFSSRAVQILSSFKVKFFHVDILKNLDIRNELPKFSNWPTFPQIWISGKLIGGSDILFELYKNGKLQEIIKKALKGSKNK